MASFLSDASKDQLALYLDATTNIPFVRGASERAIFRKLVDKIDQILAERIPDEILATLTSKDFEIEGVVADALKDNLVPMLLDLIYLPIVPRALKERILGTFVDLLVKVMASATTIDERLESFFGRQATA